jgi:hypothetical protein
MLHAVGSADNAIGCVFGMHLNSDASMDSGVVEADAVAAGDYQAKALYRRYARCWLKEDYMVAARRIANRKIMARHGMESDIKAAYDETIQRDDVEVSETRGSDGGDCPPKGCIIQVQQQMLVTYNSGYL